MKMTPWYVRPRIVLPLVGGLIVLVAIVTPTVVNGRTGDPRVSSYNTGPLGASLVHELLTRLDWQTERRLGADLVGGPEVVHAVISPAIPLRTVEVHALLEHARAGGGLFLVLGPGTGALQDSLDVMAGAPGLLSDSSTEKSDLDCEERESDSNFAPLWFGASPFLRSLTWVSPQPSGMVELLHVQIPATLNRRTSRRPAMVAFPYRRGRIVLVADPDVVRNDALRVCEHGFDVATVRAFEYLRTGGSTRTRIVFDEYHQYHGAHPGTVGAITSYLGGAPTGRTILQVAVAGLLLLIAAAPRAVPPRAEGRIERRSPFEHVHALARAYEAVSATRTAARRLLRGLRRRTEHGVRRVRGADGDDAFLRRVEALSPAHHDDVALVRRALALPITSQEFAALGAAIHRLESTLTRR